MNRRDLVKTLPLMAVGAIVLTEEACSAAQLTMAKGVMNTVVATANGIKTTIQTLLPQLPPTEQAFLNGYLVKGIDLIGKINIKFQAITKWPPSNAQDIIALISQTVSLIDEAITNGTIQFGSGPVMQKVGLTLAILKGALSTLNGLLGGPAVVAQALQKDKEHLEQIAKALA